MPAAAWAAVDLACADVGDDDGAIAGALVLTAVGVAAGVVAGVVVAAGVGVGVGAGVGACTASVTGVPTSRVLPGAGSWRITIQSSPALPGCASLAKCAAVSASVALPRVSPLTDGTSAVFGGAASTMSTPVRTTSAPASGTWLRIEYGMTPSGAGAYVVLPIRRWCFLSSVAALVRVR